MPMSGGEYTIVMTTPVDEHTQIPTRARSTNGGMQRDERTQSPVITIDIDAIDDAPKEIEAGWRHRCHAQGRDPGHRRIESPAAKRDAARRIGAVAGLGIVLPQAQHVALRVLEVGELVAGPFFLASVGSNTWASLDYLHSLGWEFVGGEQVPWPSLLARGPYGWAQVANYGPADCDPRRRGARSCAAQTGEQFCGRAARTARGGADVGRV
jgi:hypothetical protein